MNSGMPEFKLPTIEVPEINVSPIVVVPQIIPFDFKLDVDFPEIDSATFDKNQFLSDSGMNFSAEDMEALSGMDAAQVAQIAQIQMGLLQDLEMSFNQVGMSVQINEKTGEIALDASVLFDVDSAELSPEGKELLQKFMQVYTFVVFNEKYEDSVGKILIEGHTDSDGEYGYNLNLSQSRADTVLDYVLSDACGVKQEYRQPLKASSEAKGYSYDRLVLDANGQEDKDASRRVTFRFLIDID